jgi:hypothetical protein
MYISSNLAEIPLALHG